ncbi:hypothetical protein PFICI_09536 [Pestalotiopsis fici W106-1]|uniref:GAR domain-containing protein n=1 Tax=Pestalotiopsis fici (strain W106-1 / CGMCC3.15140) TaxID=1229662 RepID=W3X0M3_PESFW|nr:uncharacterized protein PFICI_09536 [Pestalotiopsis fici W106-1]ETS79683.1 hypothetical protein PFICI_09536 [Pestalotiopsis fici W106-1]
MADPANLSTTTPQGQRSTMRRTLRSTSPQSPSRRRGADALLMRLTPASAVEALRVPSGVLKSCLDEASPSEQHFAMRTAIASKKIHEWLDELLDWPWPKDSTSAGFEMPPTKRRKYSESQEPVGDGHQSLELEGEASQETEYMGSVPATEIVRYEGRIEQVQKGLDELDLEDIKSHVLFNHIMPLSRTGTPISDAGFTFAASSMPYTKMEDITAVITAITVQTLPNLSRLTKLLKTWNIRIIVLRKVPTVLRLITEAQVALKSGWSAIQTAPPPSTSVVSRKDFEVMNSVLRQKVSLPGRDLDYMLDILEGMRDTLPDAWLDQMDAVEKDYAEWVVTAERRVRRGEWGDVYAPSQSERGRAAPTSPQPKIRIQTPSPTRDQSGRGSASSEEEVSTQGSTEQFTGAVEDVSQHALQKRETEPSRRKAQDVDGPADGVVSEAALSEMNRNILRAVPEISVAGSQLQHKKSLSEFDAESSILESVYEEDEDGEDELQLPPARFDARRFSERSMASTVLRDPASDFGLSDNDALRDDFSELELTRVPDADAQFSSDGPSPPSSPPLRYMRRTPSVSFNGIPESPEEDSSPPLSPLDPPPHIFDTESSFDYGTRASSPEHPSTVSEVGDDLHQQIRAVLKGIPSNIRLSTRPSAINLNPPDLQLPSRPRARTSEPYRRSTSAVSTRSTMSSRSETPWLLAPARASRPQSRASRETQTYYLSRSNGEPPLKLLVRCVGEKGERVMVRVGGGWADLGEYLKEYAIHHSRRSKGEGKVEVRDSSTLSATKTGSSPPARPASALDSPMTPLAIRKTRKVSGGENSLRRPAVPARPDSPPSDESSGDSRDSYAPSNPNSSILGMSGPHPKKTRSLDEESRQWVEDMRNKVRTASGEQRTASGQPQNGNKFGELGKVGGTKRVYRKKVA